MQGDAQSLRKRQGSTVCGVRERPMNARHTSTAVVGRSVRQIVPPAHTLHDRAENLRIALSDLKIQAATSPAKFRRV